VCRTIRSQMSYLLLFNTRPNWENTVNAIDVAKGPHENVVLLTLEPKIRNRHVRAPEKK
jgi:hypothetical protein